MNIGIVYALAKKQVWLTIEIPEGATVQDALARSGILTQFPEIDLTQQKVGVFGKVCTLETRLEDGDRVEIYRPLIADPKTLKALAKGEQAAARSEKS